MFRIRTLLVVAACAMLAAALMFGWAPTQFAQLSTTRFDPDRALGFALAYWNLLQVLTVTVALATLISSCDDLLIDLVYWRNLIGTRIQRLWRRPPPQHRLAARFEKSIAIMVPAWREAEVIAAMLTNTNHAFDYERFHIFVGVYANDPDTAREVNRVRLRFPNVHRADVPHEGPTSKADCLNWIIQNIFRHEERTGERFDVFVLHDAEDVVHPFGLRVINWYIDFDGMVQLPVLSLNRRWWEFVAGHYMDEFAEAHCRDLRVRSALTGVTPSAGVATAFRRDALEALVAKNDGRPFNTESLTEDYDIAQRLHGLGFSGHFVRYHARTPRWRKAMFRKGSVRVMRRELVATREYFPDDWHASVRQKSRWMLGISYLGWRQLGWFGSLTDRYFLYRDRKTLFTAPIGALAYFLILNAYGYWLLALAFPDLAVLPPLAGADWLRVVILLNFGFLLNRILHRIWFTGTTHGLVQAFLSPLRIVVSNLIAFAAFGRSMRLFLTHLITRRPIVWDKTRHAFPSMAELRHAGDRLGEVLRFWGYVDDATIEDALAAQARSYRPLGLLLMDRGAISDEVLAEAFAERAEAFVRAVDVRQGPSLAFWNARMTARFGAFPLRPTDSAVRGAVEIALAEPLEPDAREALERILAAQGVRHVTYAFAPLGDIAFAARFGEEPERVAEVERAIDGLVASGRLDERDRPLLWRAVRRRYVRLGDALVRAGAIDHAALAAALASRPADARLGEHLVALGLVGGDAIERAVQAQDLSRWDLGAIAEEERLVPEAAGPTPEPEPTA